MRKRETIGELITREQRKLARRELAITWALLAVTAAGWLWCVWRGFTIATN
jgi:hypothetical protein